MTDEGLNNNSRENGQMNGENGGAASTEAPAGGDRRGDYKDQPGGTYVKLYIGNLDYRVSEDELREHFRDYLKDMIKLTLKHDRGFAFLAFPEDYDGHAVGRSSHEEKQITFSFANLSSN